MSAMVALTPNTIVRMTRNSPARQPFSRVAFDAHLSQLGVTPLEVVVPDEDRQLVRLLVEPGQSPTKLGSDLRSRFDRGFLVVRSGPPAAHRSTWPTRS